MSSPPPQAIDAAIELAYSQWTRTASWPTVDWVQLRLRRTQKLGDDEPLGALIRVHGLTLFQNALHLGGTDNLAVNIAGLARLDEARDNELAFFVRVIRLIAQLSVQHEPDPRGRAGMDITYLELGHKLAPAGGWMPAPLDWAKFVQLVQLDYRVYNGLTAPSDKPEEFTLTTSPDVERYRTLEGIDQYLEMNADTAASLLDHWHAVTAQPELPKERRRIFLIHGHDLTLLRSVESWIRAHVGDGESYILMDQAHQGRTMIEKFSLEADASDYAIAMFTADDLARPSKSTRAKLRARARQNVVLETGFAMAKLGRPRVCVILDRTIEQPSDIEGLGIVPLDNWKEKLAVELRAAGFSVDEDEAVVASE